MRAAAAFLVLVLLANSCAQGTIPIALSTGPAPSPTQPVAVVDDRGRLLTLAAAARHVVSLSPAATEIVYALGAGNVLAAVDDFSDFPAQAKALPHLSGVDVTAEAILGQHPDLILLPTFARALPELDRTSAATFALEPPDLAGVYRNVRAIGALVGHVREAESIITDMSARIEGVAARARATVTRPRVLHEIDSSDPAHIYVAGPRNFIDAMIATAGGINVAASATTAFPALSPEQIVAADPDVIVLADAKYGATPSVVATRPGWSVLTAVRRGALYPIDDDLVSRFGPRLVAGYEAYLRLLHPELF